MCLIVITSGHVVHPLSSLILKEICRLGAENCEPYFSLIIVYTHISLTLHFTFPNFFGTVLTYFI